jgi:hypothetical protein
MRLGLIGSTGHWQTYAPALERVRGLTLAAVAAAGPEETTSAFDHAPGLSVDTRRYDDARKMLETERLDVVQVCCRSDLRPSWMRLCLDRGLPVIAEKPLAMDLPTLEGLYHAARKAKAEYALRSSHAAGTKTVQQEVDFDPHPPRSRQGDEPLPWCVPDLAESGGGSSSIRTRRPASPPTTSARPSGAEARLWARPSRA